MNSQCLYMLLLKHEKEDNFAYILPVLERKYLTFAIEWVRSDRFLKKHMRCAITLTKQHIYSRP